VTLRLFDRAECIGS